MQVKHIQQLHHGLESYISSYAARNRQTIYLKKWKNLIRWQNVVLNLRTTTFATHTSAMRNPVHEEKFLLEQKTFSKCCLRA